MSLSSDVVRVAVRQGGVLSRTDLRAASVSRGQLYRMVRDGDLARLGNQTFVIPGTPRTERMLLAAACLETAGYAALRSGLRLTGVGRLPPMCPPEVLVVRRTSDPRLPLAQVHTTTYLPREDRTVVDGIPCTSVARSLFSMAGLVPKVSSDLVRDLVDEAVRDRKASDPWLWSRLEDVRRSGRNGVSVLETILTRRAGGEVTESWLERQFLEVVRNAGLPEPRCQRRVEHRGAFVARVDFLYEGSRIVVEVTGQVAHATDQQRAADAKRRNLLQLAGYLVLEFTYADVVGAPELVIERLREALAGR